MNTPTKPEPEIMATRRTFDGMSVLFWTDGLVTGGVGARIKGVGVARDEQARELDVQASWIVAGDIELYCWAELPKVIKAARAATRAASEAAPPIALFRKAVNRGCWNGEQPVFHGITDRQRWAIEHAGAGVHAARKYAL